MTRLHHFNITISYSLPSSIIVDTVDKMPQKKYNEQLAVILPGQMENIYVFSIHLTFMNCKLDKGLHTIFLECNLPHQEKGKFRK